MYSSHSGGVASTKGLRGYAILGHTEYKSLPYINHFIIHGMISGDFYINFTCQYSVLSIYLEC